MSALPPGVSRGPGRRLPVSQRGWFTRLPDGSVHFTACMFAGLSQILERRGFRLPLGRAKPAPGEPDNFVHQLQLAGDPTPQNGSTIRQSQAALRKLFGDTPTGISFGTMSDAEVQAELAKGATIRISIDCSKLPRRLRRWVGYGYTGRHAIALDDVKLDEEDAVQVALTDPMWKPAREIRSTWAWWTELAPAIVRTAKGIVVTIGYQGDGSTPATPEPTAPPAPPDEPAESDAARADRLEAELADEHELRLAQAERSQQLRDDVESAIARYNAPMEAGS